jgi:MoaA/NifB/PqqE/SkfB family radical SAM enzyme
VKRGSLADSAKVLQLHPTRRCNLRCLHCYSSSGPEARDTIPLHLLASALGEARSEGYDLAGVSGGEPLLYPDLAALVEKAKGLGYYTTVTTNGMLLNRARLAPLRGTLDLLAVSLDGVRESHNQMRASRRAFDAMRRGLAAVREQQFVFGFIFTLTQWNLHELDAVAEIAVEEGASLLVVHPLEMVGRARDELVGHRPDGLELSTSALAVAHLQRRYESRLLVQWDCFDRSALAQDPARYYAAGDNRRPRARLADLVSPLVVEPDGALVPIEYGFPRAFALGNLHRDSLETLAQRWKAEGYGPFLRHCQSVYADVLERSEEGRFFNWYEEVALERTLARPDRTSPLHRMEGECVTGRNS